MQYIDFGIIKSRIWVPIPGSQRLCYINRSTIMQYWLTLCSVFEVREITDAFSTCHRFVARIYQGLYWLRQRQLIRRWYSTKFSSNNCLRVICKNDDHSWILQAEVYAKTSMWNQPNFQMVSAYLFVAFLGGFYGYYDMLYTTPPRGYGNVCDWLYPEHSLIHFSVISQVYFGGDGGCMNNVNVDVCVPVCACVWYL